MTIYLLMGRGGIYVFFSAAKFDREKINWYEKFQKKKKSRPVVIGENVLVKFDEKLQIFQEKNNLISVSYQHNFLAEGKNIATLKG